MTDGGSHRSTHRFLQDTLQVSVIMTPKASFVTCRPSDSMERARGRASDLDLDNLPVIDSAGAITGVIHTKGPQTGSDAVSDHLQPLCEQMLIGADASIVEFVRQAHSNPFKFVVSREGIAGLVAISDLQQLATRAALFTLLTSFELAIASIIEDRFGVMIEDWPANTLDPDELSQIRVYVRKARRNDTYVHDLVTTSLIHKIKLIRPVLETFGHLEESAALARDAQNIKDLRDNLAHAKYMAVTRDQEAETSRTVDRIANSLTFLFGLKIPAT